MSAGFQWRDYSRDFRTTKWGSTVILQGNNHEPGMSALGQKADVGSAPVDVYAQKRTSLGAIAMSALCLLRDRNNRSDFVRPE
jgi:hypothetical protein